MPTQGGQRCACGGGARRQGVRSLAKRSGSELKKPGLRGKPRQKRIGSDSTMWGLRDGTWQKRNNKFAAHRLATGLIHGGLELGLH